jgi:cytochrome o ubiquinol oxidase subunit 2
MKTASKLSLIGLLVLGVVTLAAWYLHGTNIAVLNPKGPVAAQERNLIIFASLLSLLVVIPVFTLTAVIAWRYRESNSKARYSPELDHSRIAETLWWLIPSALILTLSVVAWDSSHTLDPYRPLTSTKPPITIQVVALDWKWLFIYPQLHIATVNYVQFPQQTPINFELTADAPMNSFWIPQLGGQIYAMPGMSTQLHLMADGAGSYRGLSANISGQGFAGMTFTAKSSSQADFDRWVGSVRQAPTSLNLASYNRLAAPSQNLPPTNYSPASGGLYDTIVDKYMLPTNQLTGARSAMGSTP